MLETWIKYRKASQNQRPAFIVYTNPRSICFPQIVCPTVHHGLAFCSTFAMLLPNEAQSELLVSTARQLQALEKENESILRNLDPHKATALPISLSKT
ncbi:hypothetical protein T4B_6626 [Trichinella pseudospiralis]|uniref:Uncharacterized protein n=1 Tax=Trichinella pseudospiralis TaxID=6337 RepID=A0A0V1IS47_TRIPS|nr:hypothetical protein T4B_6626 [Trichinella pseudospiralis]